MVGDRAVRCKQVWASTSWRRALAGAGFVGPQSEACLTRNARYAASAALPVHVATATAKTINTAGKRHMIATNAPV